MGNRVVKEVVGVEELTVVVTLMGRPRGTVGGGSLGPPGRREVAAQEGLEVESPESSVER